jgi:hypothetical protein
VNTLLFFSSDSHPLYEEDIYKSICLPKGYVIHFRYDEADVSQEALEYLAGFDSEPHTLGLITFAVGNKSILPAPQRTVNLIPIRFATVAKVHRTQNTGLIHFFLRLENFTDGKIESQPPSQPPNTYVSLLDFEETTEGNSWTKTIDRVAAFFPNQNFVSMGVLSRDGILVEPKYDRDLFESYYQLKSQKSYILDVAYSKGGGGHDSLGITVGDKVLSIDTSESEKLGNSRDNRRFGLNVGEVQSTTVHSFISVSPDGLGQGVELLLKLRLQRSWSKSILFGILTGVLLLPAGYKVAKDDSLLVQLELWQFISVMSVLFVVTSLTIAALHRLFNKK